MHCINAIILIIIVILSPSRLDLGAYGASIARPLPLKIPGYAYAVYNVQLRNIGKKHSFCPTNPTEMY